MGSLLKDVITFLMESIEKFTSKFVWMTLLKTYHHQINSLCVKHKVNTLFAFGSVLLETFNNESDIDLLVNFEPIDIAKYADNYYDLKFSLQNLLKRKIDLIEEKAISNPYFLKAINNNKKLIYGTN